MSDPSKLETKQERAVVQSARVRSGSGTGKGSTKKEGKPQSILAELYKTGITILRQAGYVIELKEGGDHCNHSILKASEVKDIRGVEIKDKRFKPLQEIHSDDDFSKIATLFLPEICSQEVKDFWSPLYNPKPGESELICYSARLLKMQKVREKRDFSEPIHLGHTFDPTGSLTDGQLVENPRIWVPPKEWFAPQLYKVTFSDVFTIFPPAERKLLMLLIGRIGVGKSNHIPQGWKNPVSHTARMAAVIVGKDAG